MQFPVHNTSGEIIDYIEISDGVFAVPFNTAVVHQAMVRQMANRRLGTADTKTRGEVRGSTRKPYRQKHTGWARRGSRRSPVLKGGGVAFGPHPRDYRQDMPKKMRRLALRCLLSAKARDGELSVIDGFELNSPKTKEMAHVLNTLGIRSSTLIVTPEPNINVIKSARNLPKTKTLPAPLLNVLDMLSYKSLVTTVAAVRRAEQIWGRDKTGEENALL